MGLNLTVKASENVNYAISMRSRKIVDQVTVESDRAMKAVLHFSADPKIFSEVIANCQIQKGQQVIDVPSQAINVELFREGIREARECQITVSLEDPENRGTILASGQKTVHVQPYNHWDEAQSRESLIAFLTPNNELVSEVVAKAAEILQKDGLNLNGYNGHSPKHVLKIAGAIYEAICERKLNYNLSPRSFENAGQKIRLPASVLSEATGIGTCIDLAVLFATCLEAVNLRSALLLTRNHCLAGVWVEERSFSDTILEDLSVILEQAEIVKDDSGNYGKPREAWSGEEVVSGFYPVENTRMTGENGISFEDAVRSGMKSIPEIQYILDVYQGRRHGIGPAFTYTSTPRDSRKQEQGEVSGQDVMAPLNRRNDRIDQLRNEAMDLSRRNPLVAGVPENESVRLHGCRPANLLKGGMAEDAFTNMVYGSLKKQGLSELDSITQMKKLFQIVRESERGNRKGKTEGKLYLTFGELVYEYGNSICRAPLYLCPVEIYLNAQGRAVVAISREELYFNPVLIALMQQKNNIDLEDIAKSVNKTEDLYNYVEKHLEEDIEKIRFRITYHEKWKAEPDPMTLSFLSVPNASTIDVLDSEELKQNPIANGILADHMNWDNHVRTVSADNQISTDVYVLPADQSQIQVIKQMEEKAAQIVTGPAGNGKSQTIVNAVCEQMHNGRNTLIITKKYSAMEVLYDQMDKLGIAPFVLRVRGQGKELQDGIRKQVSGALGYLENGLRTMSDPFKIPAENFRNYGNDLCNINSYMRKQSSLCQKTYIELMEEYCGLQGPELGSVTSLPREKWDDARVLNALEYIARTMKLEEQDEAPYSKYLRFDQAEQTIDAARQNVKEALEAHRKAMEDISKIDRQLKLNLTGGDKYQMQLISKYVRFLKVDMERLLADGEDYSELEREAEEYDQEVRDSILELLDEIEDHEEPEKIGGLMGILGLLKRFLFKKENLQSKLMNALQASLPDSLFWEIEAKSTEEIRDFVSGKEFSPLADKDQEERLEKLKNFRECCERLDQEFSELPPETRQGIKTGAELYIVPDNNTLRQFYMDIARDIKNYSVKQKAAVEAVVIAPDLYRKDYPGQSMASLLEQWLKETEKRAGQVRLADNFRLKEYGLESVAKEIDDRIRNGEMKPENIVAAYRKSACRLMLREMEKECTALAHFGAMDYEISLKNYIDSEKKIRKMIRQNLIREHLYRNKNLKEGYQEEGTAKLHRFANNRVQKFSVKDLFLEAHDALRKLFPCMMMTPETAADLLFKSKIMFDLVIFDEGSQTATFEAMPAILKAKRICVFGDRMQMMPQTAFRVRSEADGMKNPIESILEACHFMPNTLLTTHYRSDNDDIVSFSNKKFYNGMVHTFPSVRLDSRNLTMIRVENGIYNGGKAGKNWNEAEAEKVIETLYQICDSLPEESKDTIGVITSNAAQRDLIQDKYNKEREKKTLGKSVSIVNLEECQGKEWDHVIISTVYGPTEDGSISMNMGLIQQEDGENRLNVMITRAKKKLYLVTSLRESMFGGRELNEGVKCLRDFIKYADELKGNSTYTAFASSEDLEDEQKTNGLRDISKAVIRMLLENGYEVHTDIGSSRLKVDLGVVSKTDPGRYDLGILLDHVEEKELGSIREREVDFPYTLEQRGWKLYRLNSVAWYREPARTRQELLRHLTDTKRYRKQWGDD